MLFGDEFVDQTIKASGLGQVHIVHDGFKYFLLPSGSLELNRFAEAVYYQGRKDQRESLEKDSPSKQVLLAIRREREACAKLIDKIGYSHAAGLNQYIASEFSRAADKIRARNMGGGAA